MKRKIVVLAAAAAAAVIMTSCSQKGGAEDVPQTAAVSQETKAGSAEEMKAPEDTLVTDATWDDLCGLYKRTVDDYPGVSALAANPSVSMSADERAAVQEMREFIDYSSTCDRESLTESDAKAKAADVRAFLGIIDRFIASNPGVGESTAPAQESEEASETEAAAEALEEDAGEGAEAEAAEGAAEESKAEIGTQEAEASADAKVPADAEQSAASDESPRLAVIGHYSSTAGFRL